MLNGCLLPLGLTSSSVEQLLVVIESPVRSGYLMPRGPNQDPNQLGL